MLHFRKYFLSIAHLPAWDAEQYLRFNDERKRPCRELAARVAVGVWNSDMATGRCPNLRDRARSFRIDN
jgi:hypothetical protein